MCQTQFFCSAFLAFYAIFALLEQGLALKEKIRFKEAQVDFNYTIVGADMVYEFTFERAMCTNTAVWFAIGITDPSNLLVEEIA